MISNFEMITRNCWLQGINNFLRRRMGEKDFSFFLYKKAQT